MILPMIMRREMLVVLQKIKTMIMIRRVILVMLFMIMKKRVVLSEADD